MKALATYTENPREVIGYKRQRPAHSETSEWKSQVAEFVTQCFETFPQFGEMGLETKIKTFNVGLEDYTLEEIDYGFRQWLKESKKMPLPVDIVTLAKSHRAHVASVSKPHVPAMPLPRPPAKSVPWAYMSWKQIEDRGFMPKVEEHLAQITREHGEQRADEYLHFLKTGPQNAGV